MVTMLLQLLFAASVVLESYASRTPAEIRQWILSQALDCTQENLVTSKELQLMMSNQLPGTKNSNCFIACVLKRIRWIDEKGNYNLEATLNMADKEYADSPAKLDNARKLFDLCKKVNDDPVTDGEAGCDRAHNLAKCLLDNAPEMGFDLSKM